MQSGHRCQHEETSMSIQNAPSKESHQTARITKTCLYKVDPLKPHFYVVIYRVIHYWSYFCSKNIDCGYSLEPPRRGGSNEYPQSMF